MNFQVELPIKTTLRIVPELNFIEHGLDKGANGAIIIGTGTHHEHRLDCYYHHFFAFMNFTLALAALKKNEHKKGYHRPFCSDLFTTTHPLHHSRTWLVL